MDTLLSPSNCFTYLIIVFVTTFHSTVDSSIVYQNQQQLQLTQHQQRQLQQQRQQQSTGNYYSNQYVNDNSNRGYTSHLVARKGGLDYDQQTGSGRSSNYGIQENLNGYTYGPPQAQIPVLMVPIVPDFRLIYQAQEPYPGNPMVSRFNNNNQQQSIGPSYSNQQLGSSAPRYSSYYNVELVNMLYGRPQSTIINQQDSQFAIRRK